jgi:hypothetical protein
MDLSSSIDHLTLQDRAITIDSIPPEILISIFCQVVWSNSLWKADYPVLCLISCVCHHWRELARGTPALWTKVDTLDVGTAALMLARSQHHPVAICANEENGPINAIALEHILNDASCAGRIKALYLRANMKMVTHVLSVLASRRIIDLETLIVNVSNRVMWLRQESNLSSIFSSVRILHISGLKLDFATQVLYQNLVDLSVEGLGSASHASSLCEMLRHTKALQRLSLRNAARASLGSAGRPPVSLLFLEQFNLAGDSLTCAYISMLVDTPPSCTTSILCIDEDLPTGEGYFSSVVSSAYNRIGDARYCTLTLSEGVVHLRWYAASQEHINWPMHPLVEPLVSASLVLGFTTIWGVLLSSANVLRLCESISTVSIDDLIFESSDDPTYAKVSAAMSNAFLAVLQIFHRVKVIRASGFYARIFCTAMKPSFGYPALEALCFNELHLAYSPRLTHAELMMLREYLLCRLQHERQVEHLVVRRCGGMKTNTARAFQQIVHELTVTDCFERMGESRRRRTLGWLFAK